MHNKDGDPPSETAVAGNVTFACGLSYANGSVSKEGH